MVPVHELKYPDPGSSGEDLYDIAYRWGWETPELRELVYLCYKTPDLTDNARRYFASEELREAVRILSELCHPPSKDCRVLDFGCGNGVACYALSRSGYWVLGIDASEGELAGLGAARQIRGLDGADFAVRPSRGRTLNLEDAAFGVVWLREALHHIEDLPGFLAEAARILEPGGVICCLRDVVVWNEEQRADFFANHPFHPITNDEGCHALGEYLEAFGAAGLDVVRLLEPYGSPINTYPNPFRPGVEFDPEAARQRKSGYDLYSFFARKRP